MLAAIAAGMVALGRCSRFLVLGLATNQVASGLALTILGLGLSGLIGAGFVGTQRAAIPDIRIPGLSELPVVGQAALRREPVRLRLDRAGDRRSLWFLGRSRAGLMLRSIGENHTSAHALGLPVMRVALLAILFGGGCAGLAGAYLSLVYTPFWSPGMTAGRGWIALALVVFASWKPLRRAVRRLSVRRRDGAAAARPGGLARLSLAGAVRPSPIVATIVALVIMSLGGGGPPARPDRWEPLSCRTADL